jgi:hypothetical protein
LSLRQHTPSLPHLSLSPLLLLLPPPLLSFPRVKPPPLLM